MSEDFVIRIFCKRREDGKFEVDVDDSSGRMPLGRVVSNNKSAIVDIISRTIKTVLKEKLEEVGKNGK